MMPSSPFLFRQWSATVGGGGRTTSSTSSLYSSYRRHLAAASSSFATPGGAVSARTATAVPPSSPRSSVSARSFPPLIVGGGPRRLSDVAGGDVGDGSSLRRRRRRRGGAGATGGGASSANENAALPPSSPLSSSPDEAFSPRDPKTGDPLDAAQYLALASLSPWVPTPDAAAKRLLEIADATGAECRHVDLGCGDGRINFAAVQEPCAVGRSTGFDVDDNVLERCRERLRRRFAPTTTAMMSSFARKRAAPAAGGANTNADANAENVDGDGGVKSEAERLEFLRGDLVKVVARERERYLRSKTDDPLVETSVAETVGEALLPSSPQEEDVESDLVDRRLDEATVVTMYFVSDALQKLRPYLASRLAGKVGVRVLTVGYDVKGWEGAMVWAERVLGLGVFRYDMDKLSRKEELSALWDETDSDDDTKKNGDKGNMANSLTDPNSLNADSDAGDVNHNDDDDEEAVAIRRKRRADFEELQKGLRIHHDEDLEEFPSVRNRRQAEEQREKILEYAEEWETIDGGWDFDEDEDPGADAADEDAAARRKAGMAATTMGRRAKIGAKSGGKGKSAASGSATKTPKGKSSCGGEGGTPKPKWKKPE